MMTMFSTTRNPFRAQRGPQECLNANKIVNPDRPVHRHASPTWIVFPAEWVVLTGSVAFSAPIGRPQTRRGVTDDQTGDQIVPLGGLTIGNGILGWGFASDHSSRLIDS